MKFKKVNEPIIVKNKDFKRCILFISFPIKENDEAKLKILRDLPFNKSAKYNTEKKMHEITVNSYCLSYQERIAQIGKTAFLELAVYFPSKESLGKDVLEDNLKLIKEIIYNPYLENGAFPEKEINDIREVIKNNINRNFNDAMWYYSYKKNKIMDENDFLVSKIVENPKLLDSVTPENLYKFYLNVIKESPIVFLAGNVDVDSSKKKIKEILLGNKEEIIEFEKKYNNYCKDIPNTPKEVVEKSKFKSTGVYHNYKIKDLNSERDIILLRIVSELLSSNSSRILIDTLRKENDLVYRGGVNCDPEFGSLTLNAITGKDNIKKVEEVYYGVMDKITDISFIEEKLSLIKEEYKLDEELVKERIYDILIKDVDKYIGLREKSIYESIKEIEAKEVQTFIKNRLVLVSKYIGVGEENE